MKKLSIAVVALIAMVFASCGNKSQQDAEAQDSLKSFEQEQIEAAVKMHLDSIAADFSQMKGIGVTVAFSNGTIKLSDDDKKVKPTYLIDPASVSDLATLAQKYRAINVLFIDKIVAQAYDMDVAPYDEAIAKLGADVNDPALNEFKYDTHENLKASVQALYEAEEKAGRVNLFWQAEAAAIVEQLYIVSQNIDLFVSAFDDKSASDVTFRIILLKDAIDRLVEYDPEMQAVSEALKPVEVLNATNVTELKEQLLKMKEELAVSRAALLK